MSLINKRACKQLILDTAGQVRHGRKFTRVGDSSFVWLEAEIRHRVEEEVRSHPSIGKTLYLGGKPEKQQEP